MELLKCFKTVQKQLKCNYENIWPIYEPTLPLKHTNFTSESYRLNAADDESLFVYFLMEQKALNLSDLSSFNVATYKLSKSILLYMLLKNNWQRKSAYQSINSTLHSHQCMKS